MGDAATGLSEDVGRNRQVVEAIGRNPASPALFLKLVHEKLVQRSECSSFMISSGNVETTREEMLHFACALGAFDDAAGQT